jgi:hypothetical protein
MKTNTPNKALKPLFADVYVDEVDVLPDWRYHLVVPYMRLSSSHLAVRDKYRGEKVDKSAMPKDEELVLQVADGFDVLSVEADDDGGDQTQWWERAGKYLYGYQNQIPSVTHLFAEANEAMRVRVGGLGYPSLALNVPFTLTMTEAISQIRRLFKIYEQDPKLHFGMDLPDSYIAHVKLEPSRLRQDTLVKGVAALTMHREGLPLWQIGNKLELSLGSVIDEKLMHTMDQDVLADKKKVLSIMARRLIKTAALVAENAARGRFPSDKPFAEAMLTAYKRDAGRPKGSGRALRNHVHDNYSKKKKFISNAKP